MKKLTIIVFILASIFATGCSVTESPEALTAPPRLEGDKEGIKIAIKEYLPLNTKPIIPPTDDSGSYIKLIDLDGDGEEEALVFYTLEQDENPIRILVLKKKKSKNEKEPKWINLSEIKVEGQELEKVVFEDLDGDKGQEIIIGSGIKYDPYKDVTIYSMIKGDLKPLFNNSYDEIIIDDLNDDGLTEIMLLKLDKESEESFSELYKCINGKMTQIDKVSFNNKAEINYASYDYIYKDTKGIVLSTSVDEEIVNVYMMKVEDGKLKNLFKNSLIQNEKQEDIETLTPRDIDGDGTVEIALPNKLQEDTSKNLINWATEWYSYDGEEGIELKALNYYDEKLSIRFDLPLEWKDQLNITNITKNENTVKQEEYVKVEYKEANKNYNTHLFTIYIYDRDKLKSPESIKISENSKEILKDSNRIYYIDRNKEMSEARWSSMNAAIDKIVESFKPLDK